MIICRGNHSGFCFGVKRAVDTALSFDGENNFLLGEIIHNQSVNKALTDKGL
jgi:4-hydroxy-3-methylbut-2-enyl diphosphate reductase IspH